jgi:hypothetical protein
MMLDYSSSIEFIDNYSITYPSINLINNNDTSLIFVDNHKKRKSPIRNLKYFRKQIDELNNWIKTSIMFELSYINQKELVMKIRSTISFRYFDKLCNLSKFPHDNFKMLTTEADYSCLVHSVLLAVCKNYKKIPRDEYCDSEEFGNNISLRSYIGKKYRGTKLLELTHNETKNKRMVKNLKRFLGNEHLEEIANDLGIVIILFSHNKQTYKCTGETIIDNTVTPLGNRVKIEKSTPVIFIFGDGYHFQTMVYKNKSVMRMENVAKISYQMKELLQIFSS